MELMKFVWLLFLIGIIGVVVRAVILPQWIKFSYEIKPEREPQLVCENFSIELEAQKLIDYEILTIPFNITVKNIFKSPANITFNLRDATFENEIIKEIENKPFAIYYGEWGYSPWGGSLAYVDSPELYFSPNIRSSPDFWERIENDNIEPNKEAFFNFTLKILDDRKQDVRKDWAFNISLGYWIYLYNEETSKSCEGLIKLNFKGREPEFYLGDFIGGRTPLYSPWGDPMYGPDSPRDILLVSPAIKISNISFSLDLGKIEITFSTNEGVSLCDSFGICYDPSIVLTSNYLILRDKPFGEILTNKTEEFSPPFIINSDGKNYTLTFYQEFPLGNWYEEIWLKGKIKGENKYMNKEYEEPLVIFIGIGRLWYFK